MKAPKISQVVIRTGLQSQNKDVTVSEPEIIVFVGPNNSGKSLALSELAIALKGNTPARSYSKIISELQLEACTPEESDYIAHAIREKLDNDSAAGYDHSVENWLEQRGNPAFEGPLSFFNHPSSNNQLNLFMNILRVAGILDANPTDKSNGYFALIEGSERTEMANNVPRGDLLKPKSSISLLFTEDNLRSSWRDIILKELDIHIGIDGLSDHLKIKVGDTPPPVRAQSGRSNN